MAPLLVSIIVILFFVNYADQLVGTVIRKFADDDAPWIFPGIGLVVCLVVFYIIGLVVSTRAGRVVMSWKNAALIRIPVVKSIYGVTQQATGSLTGQFSYTRVVFLEWPREGMLALGFVTGVARREKHTGEDRDQPQTMAVVYIPTVPNPTSGNLAFVMEDDLMETDLTVEDAMKLVFSGGIVLPQKLSMARLHRERSMDEFIDRFRVDS